MIWGMLMTVTMESAVFMGKNYLINCQPMENTTDLTLKQMFDISTRLVSEQDEICGLETIDWENHSWKYLSLIGDERVINLERTKVYVFSDSVLCLGKIHDNPQSNDAWEQRLGWIESAQNYRNLNRIDVEQRISQEESYLCRCSTTLPVDQKTMEKNAWRMPNSFLCMQKDLEKDNGHSLVLVLKRSGTVTVNTVHKEYGTIWLKGCCWNSQKVVVQSFALRAQCPEVDSKARDMENCRYTMQPIWKRLKLSFAYCLCKPAQSLRSNR